MTGDATVVSARSTRRAYEVSALMVCVAAVGLVIVFAHGGLPSRFTADSNKIQQIAQGNVSFDDPGFMAIGRLYAVLDLAHNAALAGLLGFGCFLVVLWALVSNSAPQRADWRTFLMVGTSIVFAALYLGQYSKDFVILLVTLAAGRRGRSRGLSRDVWVVAAMLVIALTMRSYWILIVGVYVVARYVFAKRHSPRRIAVEVLAGYLGLALVFYVLKHQGLDYARVTVNANEPVVINSIITERIHGSTLVAGLLNSLITLAFLVVPLPLLALGSSYAAIAAIVAVMWFGVGSVLVRYLRQSEVKDQALEVMLAVVFAVVIVQAIFEPDYGSYVRHLTPIMPLLIVIPLRARHLLPRSARSQGAAMSRVGC